MKNIKLAGLPKDQDGADNYHRKPPPDLFGPRSERVPIEKYSPSFMTEMFGAGIPEYLHRVQPIQSVPTDRETSAEPHLPADRAAGLKERIIFDPADDRRVVQDTTLPPWRCVCQLRTVMTNGSFSIGTGWMAAARIVVTAAHCLYDTEGSVPAVVQVTPGLNGSSAPYGSRSSSLVRVPPQWIEGRTDNRYDYAIVILPDDQLGQQTGWFGFAVANDQHLGNMLVTSSGYPFDFGSATQLSCLGRIRNLGTSYIYHSIDTKVGQSGSPVFHKHISGARTVVGIHTDSGAPGRPNRALRITSQIFQDIRAAAQSNG